MKYLEPYVKENNLLQLSLFYFGKSRPKRTLVQWSDAQGEYSLDCVCKFGVPGSFDQDVYTACMRLWVKQGMPKGMLETSYSEIARELRLEPPKDYVWKIKKSLDKLAQARYQFTQCFIQADEDGNDRIDAHFSLFDSAALFSHHKGEGKSKKKGRSRLYFPDEIRENLEAKYYQYLDMAWYRILPDGLPRRLYEYLCKKRYRGINSAFVISEEAICRWLGITDAHTTNRRKRLGKIAQALIEKDFLKSYQFDVKKKQCTFVYAQSGPPPGMGEEEITGAIEGKVIPTEENGTAKFTDARLIAPADYTSHKALAMGDVQYIKVSPFEVKQVALAENARERDIEAKAIGSANESSDSAINTNAMVEALQWLNFIPYLRKEAVKEIASSPDFLKAYPAVRAEYERQKNKIDRPAGWVRKAFAQGWHHTKTQLEQKVEKRNELDDKIAHVKNMFANGVKYYRGEKIESIFDGGVCLENPKGQREDPIIIMWPRIDMALFSREPPDRMQSLPQSDNEHGPG